MSREVIAENIFDSLLEHVEAADESASYIEHFKLLLSRLILLSRYPETGKTFDSVVLSFREGWNEFCRKEARKLPLSVRAEVMFGKKSEGMRVEDPNKQYGFLLQRLSEVERPTWLLSLSSIERRMGEAIGDTFLHQVKQQVVSSAKSKRLTTSARPSGVVGRSGGCFIFKAHPDSGPHHRGPLPSCVQAIKDNPDDESLEFKYKL